MSRYDKIFERVKPVLGNTFSLALPGLSNLLLSLLVIRIYNAEWWGAIVELQVIYYLATNFTAWGNKEFLLREFSNSPSNIRNSWSSSFNTRALYILIPVCVGLFIFNHSVSGIFLISWVVLRHIQQSFEVIATYEKKFNTIVVSEFASLFMLCGTLFFFKNVEYEMVLLFITISYLLRTLIVGVSFRKYLLFAANIDLAAITASFTFMLLAFSNIVQTKADLMVLDKLMSKTVLAQYGVVTSFIFLSKSAITFIIYPFVKNIYRLNKDSIKLLSMVFLKFGIAITLAGILLQYIMLTYFYHFEFSIVIYLLSFICVLPSFWYTPIVFFLFKNEQQQRVIIVNVVGILINVLACFYFIRFYGVIGGLLSMALSQVLMLAMVYYYFIRITSDEH